MKSHMMLTNHGKLSAFSCMTTITLYKMFAFYPQSLYHTVAFRTRFQILNLTLICCCAFLDGAQLLYLANCRVCSNYKKFDDLCSRIYRRPLLSLVQVKKTKPEPRVCPVCLEKVGISAQSLALHVKKAHPEGA